jgi:PEGA domain
MPAPSTDPLSLGASTTSSGFADGLGRRVLAFDREEGAMLERLTLRPELAAFEGMLRERLERVAAIEDERIARPRSIGHETDGSLVVISEFVPGSRLSDLLDIAADQGTAPGVDAAFGYLLDVLPALCGLHAGAGFAHGTIAPSRTMLTPAGQVVLLDGIYAGALSHLRYSRRKLWTDFGIAAPETMGAPRLDVGSDIAQVVLAGVMLVLGRPLYDDEFPDAIPRVMSDVIEVAQIRGGSEFASGLQEFLLRSLPVPNRRPYTSADDALFDLRGLASELGLHACRRALVDFIEQMEPSGHQQPQENEYDDVLADIAAYGFEAVSDPLDGELTSDGDPIEAEINLEGLVEEPLYDLDAITEVELQSDQPSTGDDPLALGWAEEFAAAVETPQAETEPIPAIVQPQLPSSDRSQAIAQVTVDVPSRVEPPAPVVDRTSEPVAAPAGAAAGEDQADSEPEQSTAADEDQADPHVASLRSKRAKRTRSARARKDKLRSAAVATPLATQKSPATHVEAGKPEKQEAAEKQDSAANPDPPVKTAIAVKPESPAKVDTSAKAEARLTEREPDAETDEKSASGAKDAPIMGETQPPPQKSGGGNWLVAPGRAAAFEPPVSDEQWAAASTEAPAPFGTPTAFTTPAPFSAPAPFATATPSVAAPAPIPFAPIAPVTPARPPAPAPPPRLASPTFGAPTSWSPASAGPASQAPMSAAPSSTPMPTLPQLAPLKLKEKPRAVRSEPPVEDIYAAPFPGPAVEEAGAFPWKLAAAALVAMTVLILAGRAYLPWTSASSEEPPTAATATKPVAAAPAPTAARTPPSAPEPVAPSGPATGRLEIETQPGGASIVLDGKPVGESPLALDAVPVGRHTIALTSASGTVKRTIRIENGRTLKVDVPIFSGWVGIFAPFVLEVAEGGRVIGTTEESRLMLSPGRHELTLTNHQLGYRTVETVEIEPGEVRSVSLDPRGIVNLNASPWAEVWIDGKKVGDTPLAGLKLPLGIQEITFRHPDFGERKVTVTVKGNAPAALSVTMTK